MPQPIQTSLRQWSFWQCLPLSWTTLRGKHCQHPIVVMGVVYTFRPAKLPGQFKPLWADSFAMDNSNSEGTSRISK